MGFSQKEKMTFRPKVILFGSSKNIFVSGVTFRTSGEHNQQFVRGVLAARCKMNMSSEHSGRTPNSHSLDGRVCISHTLTKECHGAVISRTELFPFSLGTSW